LRAIDRTAQGAQEMTANIPLIERNVVTPGRPHWLCRIFGHKYGHVVWIGYDVRVTTGYMVCERCKDIAASTTFGPIGIAIDGESKI
jgi:hypothetical protein